MFLKRVQRMYRVSDPELGLALKRIIGQVLIGVTRDRDGTFLLHFADWVIFVKDPFPSPIIERVSVGEKA